MDENKEVQEELVDYAAEIFLYFLLLERRKYIISRQGASPFLNPTESTPGSYIHMT